MIPTSAQHLLKNRMVLMVTIFLLAGMLIGCEGGNDMSDSTSTNDTGSLSFNVVWNQRSDIQMDYQARAVVCGGDPVEVATVSAAIVNSEESIVRFGGPWECMAPSGVIQKVPVGSGYTILFYGHNEDDRTTYSGTELNISVTKGDNDIGTINANQFHTQITSPENGTSNIDPDSAEFSWAYAPGAAEYQLWISESDDLSDPQIFYTDGLIFPLPAGILDVNTTYYWTVFPIDIYNNRSYFYDSIFSFTTSSQTTGINLTGWQYSGNSSFSVDAYWLIWGGTHDVYWAIRNNGTEATPPFTHVWVNFYLSDDTSFTSDDYLLFNGYLSTPLSSSGMEAGSGEVGTIQITLPTDSPFPWSSGVCYVGMVIDTENNVVEYNENDNSGTGEGVDYYEVHVEHLF